MTSTTVRVREETRKILRELAEQAGEPMQQILAKAVEVYRLSTFWKEQIWHTKRCGRILMPGKRKSVNGLSGMQRWLTTWGSIEKA